MLCHRRRGGAIKAVIKIRINDVPIEATLKRKALETDFHVMGDFSRISVLGLAKPSG